MMGLPQAAIPRAASRIQSGGKVRPRFRKKTGLLFIIMTP
jgi:hypothetical protein